MSDIKDVINGIYFKRYLIQIQFTTDTDFTYFHGAKLYDFLCKSLKRNRVKLGEDILLNAPESGIVRYRKGDFYNFGVTKFGKEDGFRDELLRGMDELSRFRIREHGLEGRFNLVSVKELSPVEVPDLNGDAEQDFTLRFISPLRILNTDEYIPGCKFMDTDCFYVLPFFKSLYNRLSFLNDRFGKQLPFYDMVLNGNEITDSCFHWIDMPYPEKTLGGIVGKLHLRLINNTSLRYLLWFGQLTGVGNNTSFGLGKYIIEKSKYEIPRINPVLSLLQRVLDYNNLYNTFAELKKDSEFNSNGITGLSEFEENFNLNIINLIGEVESSKYKPCQSTAGIEIDKYGKSEIKITRNVRDLTLKKAFIRAVYPSVWSMLGNIMFSRKKIYADEKDLEYAFTKLNKHGYNKILNVKSSLILRNIEYGLLLERIDALWNGGGLYYLLHEWLNETISFKNRDIVFNSGFNEKDDLSEMLSLFYLEEFDKLFSRNFLFVHCSGEYRVLDRTNFSRRESETIIENVLQDLSQKMNSNICGILE